MFLALPYHFAADQKWKSEFDVAILGDNNTRIADVQQIDRIIFNLLMLNTVKELLINWQP